LDVIKQLPASGTKITKTERRFLVSRFRYALKKWALWNYLLCWRRSNYNICCNEFKV